MGVYHITASNGHQYEVQAADDAQAQRISDFIESRVHVGDETLSGGTPPDNAIVRPPSGQVPDVASSDSISDLIRGGPSSSATGSFFRGIGHGGYLNWDDELAAAGNALDLPHRFLNNPATLPLGITALAGDALFGGDPNQVTADQAGGFSPAYEHNMNEYERQDNADQAQHPLASSLGDIGGIILNLLATRGTGSALAGRLLPRAAIPIVARAEAAAIGAPVRTALARGAAREALNGAARGAVQGGAYGGVAAAGAGRGNRAQSGALGVLTGASTGAALDASMSAFIPAIQRYAVALFGRVPHEEAMAQIIQSLRRDGFDLTRPANVQALRTELARFGGRPVSLADVGAATRARAGVGLRSPSAVQQQSADQVYSRAQGQGLRLRRGVLANVAPRTDVHALEDDLVAQRASEAERLRQAALFEGGERGQLQVLDPEEESIRRLFYTAPNGASIDGTMQMTGPGMAEVDLGLNESSNIGVSGVRDLASHFRREFPDVHTVYGSRISGARGATTHADNPNMQIMDMTRIEPASMPGNMNTRVISDPQIIALMQHPNMQRALPAALTRSRNEFLLNEALGRSNEHLGTEALTPEQVQNIMDISHGGMLDMRTLDSVKRYLDDEVSSLYRRGQGNTFTAGEAHQVQALRDALRGRMREVVPEYGHYLDQYSGSSDMIEALREGQNFHGLQPEEIAAGQADRSVAGQELYRVGAARHLSDRLSSTTDRSNAAGRILNSEEERAQLTALGLQPGAADRLNTAVGQERQFNLLPAEMANSASDARAAARADAEITPNIPYISGNPVNWFGAATRWAANHASTKRRAGINEELLPRVLETDRSAIDAIISELEQHSGERLAAALRRNRRGSRVSRGFAATIGAPVALPQEQY